MRACGSQLWPRDQIAVFRGTVQFASLKVVYRVRSMLVIFFNLNRVVHLEFITQGHTVITESYCNVPRLLRENIEHKRPKLCCMPSCASQAFMAKPPCLLARFVLHHKIKLDTQVVKKQRKWRRSSATFYKNVMPPPWRWWHNIFISGRFFCVFCFNFGATAKTF